jgi:hypothetical protein
MLKRVFKLEDVDTPIELEKRANEAFDFLHNFWRDKIKPNLLDRTN